MPWNGSGTFNRIFSWVADKAAGLDISSSRMDTDTNDLASNGFGNCLTRDGQGQPSANLPMATFRHTNVGNGVARSDYAAVNQVQDGILDWSTDSGSATAYAITLTPALTGLLDGQLCYMRAANANTTTTPTFSPNVLTAHTITKTGGVALALGDIQANQECILRYNLANTRWELLNPSNITASQGIPTTGDVKLTFKTVADTGWLLFDDGTFGSATSGSSNSNSALNQALFTIFFNNLSDTAAPLFTSTGSGTTRAAQGTAAAAWAANCRMSLSKTLGRALAVAGAGSGLTSRALGSIVGEETHLLTLSETPTGITATGTFPLSVSGIISGLNNDLSAFSTNAGGANQWLAWTTTTTHALTASPTASGTVTSNNTGGGAHNNMQPSTFMNIMVKQ